jgi:predicted  nucleic acid-binding Zn-ribbon protein
MNAVLATETVMTVEDRVRGLEYGVDGLRSDVAEIKADVKTLNARMDNWIAASAAAAMETEKRFGGIGVELGSIKTEIATVRTEIETVRTAMEKGLASVRTETATLRTDMERGFGAIRTEMKEECGAINASIEKAKLWMLVTGVGAVILVTLAHVFKAF